MSLALRFSSALFPLSQRADDGQLGYSEAFGEGFDYGSDTPIVRT